MKEISISLWELTRDEAKEEIKKAGVEFLQYNTETKRKWILKEPFTTCSYIDKLSDCVVIFAFDKPDFKK